MACINSFLVNLEYCCSGWTYEAVTMNFLCDFDISRFISSGYNPTILWTGSTDPRYSAFTQLNPYFTGKLQCYSIKSATPITPFVESAFTPNHLKIYSGSTSSGACNSCITLNKCITGSPCPDDTCFKCRKENPSVSGDCGPYLYSGCAELRDTYKFFIGRTNYDVQGLWGGTSGYGTLWTERPVPYFWPSWGDNHQWPETGPCPGGSPTTNPWGQPWYGIQNRRVTFGNQMNIRGGPPWSYVLSPGESYRNGTLNTYASRTGEPNAGTYFETNWYVGPNEGEVAVTLRLGRTNNKSIPMRAIIKYSGVTVCDTGFIGYITRRNGSPRGTYFQLDRLWSTRSPQGTWTNGIVGCGFDYALEDLGNGYVGTCGQNGPIYKTPTKIMNNVAVNCAEGITPYSDPSNRPLYARVSAERPDLWGAITAFPWMSDRTPIQQFGSPGQVGVDPDYPRNTGGTNLFGVEARENDVKIKFIKPTTNGSVSQGSYNYSWTNAPEHFQLYILVGCLEIENVVGATKSLKFEDIDSNTTNIIAEVLCPPLP